MSDQPKKVVIEAVVVIGWGEDGKMMMQSSLPPSETAVLLEQMKLSAVNNVLWQRTGKKIELASAGALGDLRRTH